MPIRLLFRKQFVESLKTLPPDRQKSVQSALRKFISEPTMPSLRFRRLEEAPDYYIISADRGDRVILKKIGDDLFEVADAGPHDNVYCRWNR